MHTVTLPTPSMLELHLIAVANCGMSCVNRKGHYTRALEEAIQTHNSQWPHAWNGKNPLHGGGSFNKMTSEARVRVDRSCWSMC